MTRLTDEELAELDHYGWSYSIKRAGDSFSYRSDKVFGRLQALVAEVRELRSQLQWERDHACENTPTRGCDCPGCSLSREEALVKGEGKE